MKQGYQVDNIGNEYWYKDDLLHREGGPAMICDSGTEYWYMHGKLHRLDGPAVEYYYGQKSWYYENAYVYVQSQEEFEVWLKYKAFT